MVVVGLKIPEIPDERMNMIYSFLEYLLVKGNSSRMWNEIREKRGLAYALRGGTSSNFQLGSYFSAFVETTPNRLKEVAELMQECLLEPLSSHDDFEALQEWLHDWYTIGHETNLDSWTGDIFHYFVHGRLMDAKDSFEEDLTSIRSITLDEIEELRARIMQPERFVTVVLRPE